MSPREENADLRSSTVALRSVQEEAIVQSQKTEILSAHRRPSSRAHIVLAEDNDDLRFVMQAILETEGYRVLACCDGLSALEACRDESVVDLLVTDFEMPNLNGIELAARLSASHQALPILLVSSSSLPLLSLSLVRKCGWQFLQKPFSVPELLEVVRALLCPDVLPAEKVHTSFCSAPARPN